MISEIGTINLTGATLGHDSSSIAESKRFLRALFESNDFNVQDNNQQVEQQEISRKTFEEALKAESRKTDYNALSNKVKELLGEENIDVTFDKDKDTKIMIMKFIDKKTKDVLKQFPAEISIKIARMVANLTNQGAVTDAKV